MKVLEIIKLSSKLLNEPDVRKCVEYCEKNEIGINQLFQLSSENITEDMDFLNSQSKKDLRLCLDCLNIVNTIISTEYYPFIKTENIEITNCEFDIENLSQKLYKIKVITQNNQKADYKLENGKILAKNGKYEIKYSFIPQEVDFNSTVETLNGKFSILTFAYGVCYQFCLIKSMMQETEFWKEKFENSLNINTKKFGSIYVKNRRWI